MDNPLKNTRYTKHPIEKYTRRFFELGSEKKLARYKSGLILTKDNKLVRFHGNMTPFSYKLINFFLWKALREGTFTELKATTMDISRALHIGDNKRGAAFKAECKKAMKTMVEIQDKFDPDEEWKLIVLIPYMDYNHGVVTAKINPDIVPYINELSGNFTPVEIDRLGKVGSYSAMRLYEVCLSWKKAGQVTYTVEEWRELLGATKKTYEKSFAQFKRGIWGPSVNNVNRLSNLNIRCAYTKDGRIVKKITVYIKEIETLDAMASASTLPAVAGTQDAGEEKRAPHKPKTALEKMVYLGFDKKTAKKYIDAYGKEYCDAQVELAIQEQKGGRLKNPAGYLRAALDSDYAGERAKEAEIIKREKDAEKENERHNKEAYELFHGKKEISLFEEKEKPEELPMPEADEEASRYWDTIKMMTKTPAYGGLSPHVIESWLAKCIPISAKDGTLELVAENNFVKDWVKDNYLDIVTNAARALKLEKIMIKSVT